MVGLRAGGRTESVRFRTAALAVSKPEMHKGQGVNVLRVDGSVQWLDAGAWWRLSNTPAEFFGTADPARLAELRKRVKLPPAYRKLLAP